MKTRKTNRYIKLKKRTLDLFGMTPFLRVYKHSGLSYIKLLKQTVSGWRIYLLFFFKNGPFIIIILWLGCLMYGTGLMARSSSKKLRGLIGKEDILNELMSIIICLMQISESQVKYISNFIFLFFISKFYINIPNADFSHLDFNSFF